PPRAEVTALTAKNLPHRGQRLKAATAPAAVAATIHVKAIHSASVSLLAKAAARNPTTGRYPSMSDHMSRRRQRIRASWSRSVVAPELLGTVATGQTASCVKLTHYPKSLHNLPYQTLAQPPGARGLRATSHWLALDRLQEFSAKPTHERVVEQGKIITAAGVSSGIDMALRLAQRIAGDDVAQAIQLDRVRPASSHRGRVAGQDPPHVVQFLRGASEEGSRSGEDRSAANARLNCSARSPRDRRSSRRARCTWR